MRSSQVRRFEKVFRKARVYRNKSPALCSCIYAQILFIFCKTRDIENGEEKKKKEKEERREDRRGEKGWYRQGWSRQPTAECRLREFGGTRKRKGKEIYEANLQKVLWNVEELASGRRYISAFQLNGTFGNGRRGGFESSSLGLSSGMASSRGK